MFVSLQKKPLLNCSLSLGPIRPVTRRARSWCRLIKKNRFPADGSRQLVAIFTAHAAVGSLQSEPRSRVVVEQRELPLLAVVAIGARGHAAFDELQTVNIGMACFAFVRRGFEIHVDERHFGIRRIMAIPARRGRVRPQQRKRCLRVVEA